MARLKLPRFIRGLDTLTDPLVGDMGSSPDCANVRMQNGLLTGRTGYRILDLEPSHIATGAGTSKTRGGLVFLLGSSTYGTLGLGFQTLGNAWTVRIEDIFAGSGTGFDAGTDNKSNSTKGLVHIQGTTYDTLNLQLIGDGTNIKVRAIIKDLAGTTVTLTSTNRTPAAWVALTNSRFIRVVRDGTNVYLYVGETLEDSSASMGVVLHEAPVNILLHTNSSNQYSTGQFFGLTIVNRVLDEYHAYWSLSWPMDDTMDTDVLGHWPALETTGTSLTDYSSYAMNFTLTNTPTWLDTANASARGLGLFTHRTRAGTRYHIFCCGRRGTSSAGAAPSGAIYIWKANQGFFPFYIANKQDGAGASALNDASATGTGFNFNARFDKTSFGDMAFLVNGRDNARAYGGTVPALTMMGLTAPPNQVQVTLSGGGALSAGSYIYAQTYYDSNTGLESALSLLATVTASANNQAALKGFGSSDARVTHVRFYRTLVNSPSFYLLPGGEVANGATPAFTDTYADSTVQNNLGLQGSDRSGNLRLKRAYLFGGPASVGSTVPTLAVAAGGSVDAGDHYYAYSWYNPTTGIETAMSYQAMATTAANKTVNLTALLLPPQNSGFTKMRIYRTKAGARLWFLVATTNTATSYSDTVADSTLTSTIELNSLPPKCRYIENFAGRVWMAGDLANPSTVYWSTAGDGENFTWTSAHIPNSGAEITGMNATEGALFIHFNDGRIFVMPHPGDNTDLELFVPVTMREWSPKGGAVSHYSIKATPYGTVWLSRDGFYLASEGGIELLSPLITPSFLNLNRVRARLAYGLYNEDEKTYRCWLSRGDNRLNEECFVYDFQTHSWVVDDLHADCAGVLYDAKEAPHYCFVVENGVLCELRADSWQDGDGTGTLSGAVAGATAVGFTNIAGRTAPVGGDGGYPIYLLKSDGTIVVRYKIDPALQVSGLQFYPSYVGLLTGSWTAYFHGIYGRWKTMMTDFSDPRPNKQFITAYLTHGKVSSGSLGVKVGTNETAIVAANGSPVALSDLMTSQCNLQASGRVIQLEVALSPPAAGVQWKLVDTEIEGDMATHGDSQ